MKQSSLLYIALFGVMAWNAVLTYLVVDLRNSNSDNNTPGSLTITSGDIESLDWSKIVNVSVKDDDIVELNWSKVANVSVRSTQIESVDISKIEVNSEPIGEISKQILLQEKMSGGSCNLSQVVTGIELLDDDIVVLNGGVTELEGRVAILEANTTYLNSRIGEAVQRFTAMDDFYTSPFDFWDDASRSNKLKNLTTETVFAFTDTRMTSQYDIDVAFWCSGMAELKPTAPTSSYFSSPQLKFKLNGHELASQQFINGSFFLFHQADFIVGDYLEVTAVNTQHLMGQDLISHTCYYSHDGEFQLF